MTGSATPYPTKTTVNSRNNSVTNRAAHRSVRYARPKSAAVRTRFEPSLLTRMRPCKCTRLDQLCRFGTGSIGATSTNRSPSPASTNRLSKFVVTKRTPCSVRETAISASWTRSGAVGCVERQSMTVRRRTDAPSRSGLSRRPRACAVELRPPEARRSPGIAVEGVIPHRPHLKLHAEFFVARRHPRAAAKFGSLGPITALPNITGHCSFGISGGRLS